LSAVFRPKLKWSHDKNVQIKKIEYGIANICTQETEVRSMSNYASECTRGFRIPLLGLVTRLGWRYRAENIFRSLITTTLPSSDWGFTSPRFLCRPTDFVRLVGAVGQRYSESPSAFWCIFWHRPIVSTKCR
jgi:hypothetical protein